MLEAAVRETSRGPVESQQAAGSSSRQRLLRDLLASRGASFHRELLAAAFDAAEAGGHRRPSEREMLDALWDLVWAGEVTNDTLAPLRAYVGGGISRRRRRKPVLSAATPPAGAGRWYAVADLHQTAPSAEESAAAVATTLIS